MTEEEIAARKFAIASQKENEADKAKEEARKKAKKEGREFDEESYEEKKTFSGRPDNAKIAGDEPADTTTTKGNRIALDKTAADSLLNKSDKNDIANVDTTWMKDEYVPVTSFIHTMKFDNYNRIYQAYKTPENYYANTFPVNENSQVTLFTIRQLIIL